MDATVLSALTAELGVIVSTDPVVLATRRHDYWAASHLRRWRGETLENPAAVVRPTEVAQVQALVRFAAAHRVGVMPFGLGSGVCGGVLADPSVIVLDMSAMHRTRSINTQDLLATFDAGKNGLEAEQEVAAEGLTIGHWPQSVAVSSVGGWVSTRASGQFSTANGNIEDLVYSIEAVLADGSLVTLGSAPRASAGPDLRHVLMGAEGTMGVVTGVTFSLRQAPEAQRYSAWYAPTMAAGIEAQRRIVQAGWLPPVMRLYDRAEVKRNFRDFVRGDTSILLLVHEGPASRVEAEVAAVVKLATDAGLEAADAAVVGQWMERRNHVSTWTDLLEAGVVVDTIEISAPWSKIDAVYDAAIASLREVPGIVTASAHSSHAYRSGINLYFSFAARADPSEMEARYFECWRRVMEATHQAGGGIAHHHGIGRLRKDYLHLDLGSSGVDLLRRLKHSLDPEGIMNPGNLIP